MRLALPRAVLAALLLTAGACIADGPIDPGAAPTASIPVAADVAAVTASGALAVSITASDIATPIGASFPVVTGLVSGELTKIPVGSARTVSATLRNLADSVLAEGTATVDIKPGKNATLRLALHVQGQAPGTLPIEITIDTVTVEPSEPVPPPVLTVVPELPRYTVSLDVPPPTRSVSVPAGADLQAAISAAMCGDELVLAGGATYRGNFILPVKFCSGWVSVRSSTPPPPAGTRVTPATAAGFARIVTPNADPAIRTAPAARGYQLSGLEVTGADGVTIVFSLIALGDGSPAQATLASVPRDFVLRQVYVHGSPTLHARRCLALNSAWTAVVDSWLSECHQPGFDSQAISGTNGPGPFRIENNYLDGGSENVMFGGDDSRSPALSPADITMRGNHVTRPLAAQGLYGAKTLFELKDARRVLVEGNVFENNWAEAQSGFAILFKSVNQGGAAPWATTADVTFRRNVVRATVFGFTVSGHPELQPVDSLTRRVLIAGNLLEESGDRWLLVDNGAADVAVEHTTVRAPSARVILACCQQPRFRLVANAIAAGTWAITSDEANGDGALARHATDAVVTGNDFGVGVQAASIPTMNGAPAPDAGADLAALAAMATRVRAGIR